MAHLTPQNSLELEKTAQNGGAGSDPRRSASPSLSNFAGAFRRGSQRFTVSFPMDFKRFTEY